MMKNCIFAVTSCLFKVGFWCTNKYREEEEEEEEEEEACMQLMQPWSETAAPV